MKEQVFINGKPAGWLMPQVKDSRQQPKSLAFKMLEERNAKAKAERDLRSFCDDHGIETVEVEHVPAEKVKCSNWDAWTPRKLFSGGVCIGTLMPRATLAELGYGIQGWSRPEADTRSEPVEAFDPVSANWFEVTAGDL